MKVSLAVSILCNLLLRGFTLKCQRCLTLADPRCEEEDCDSNEICKSVLSIVDKVPYTERSCSLPSFCGTSINTGSIKQSVLCCKTNMCNNQSMPESENGRRCYGCTDTNCTGELKPMNCTSNQDYCALGYFIGTYGPPKDRPHRFPFRGCVSEEVCAVPATSIQRIRCCCGDLCNRNNVGPRRNVLLFTAALLPVLYLGM